jgi:D-glycero-D-manno-heptose 1,7-bisphosphate phosphatase
VALRRVEDAARYGAVRLVEERIRAFIAIGIPQDLVRADGLTAGWHRRPTAFLGRDGVLNLDHGYVHHRGHFKWVDGAMDAVKLLNDRGYCVLITNQAGVAYGHSDKRAIHTLHGWMREELRRNGVHLYDVRYCPYHPEGAVEHYRRASDWRKPEAGMLRDLMAHWPVETAGSFIIGDRDTDMAAAQAAGHLFTGGNLLERVRAILGENGG